MTTFIHRGNSVDIEITNGIISLFQYRSGHVDCVVLDNSADVEVLFNMLRRNLESEYVEPVQPVDYPLAGC